MKILLEMIKMELEGETTGLEADMTHFSAGLIDFIPEEARLFSTKLQQRSHSGRRITPRMKIIPRPSSKCQTLFLPRRRLRNLKLNPVRLRERCTEPQRQTLWKGLPPLSN
jgi:hypothetical protein